MKASMKKPPSDVAMTVCDACVTSPRSLVLQAWQVGDEREIQQ